MSADLKAAHKKLTRAVMGRPGVTGTAIGETDGQTHLTVYVRSHEARDAVPDSVDGVPVKVEVTGAFRRR